MNEYKQEIEELEKEAPVLFALKKRNPFQTPENYFDALSEELISLTNLSNSENFAVPKDYMKELEDTILSQTTGMNKVEEFNTPNGYLSKLEDQILAQTTRAEQNEEASPAPTKGRIIRFTSIGIAAVAAGLALLLTWGNFTEEKQCETFACLLEKTELSEQDMLELYDEEIIKELLPSDVSLLDEVSDEDEMIDFLLEDESLDLMDLYEFEEI